MIAGGTAWFARAACRDLVASDRAAWDALWRLREGDNYARRRFVGDYCDRCPAQRQCHAYGVRTDGVGIYGGVWLGNETLR